MDTYSNGKQQISELVYKYEINLNSYLNNKYNEKAREIYNDYSEDYDKRITMINMVLDIKYIKENMKEQWWMQF